MIYLTVSTNRCLRFDGVKGEGKSVFGDEEEKEKKKKKELGLYFVYNKIYVYEKRFLSLRVRMGGSNLRRVRIGDRLFLYDRRFLHRQHYVCRHYLIKGDIHLC